MRDDLSMCWTRLRGFTLVEVLLAMAVASLLMVTLLTILSKSMDVSKQTNARMLSKSSAQAALDVMETDLDSLVVNRNAGEILAITNTPVSGASASMTKAATIYCLTTSMEDSFTTNNSGNSGLPRLVQYMISYTNSYASTNPCFALYRNIIDPTNTFNSVIGTQDLTTVTTAYSNYPLVPNVVGMSCTLYTNYGAGVWSNSGTTSTAIYSTNFPTGVVVEISLTVLDESVMPRFGSGNGVGNNSATNLIRQYGRTLIRRVNLPSPP